VVVAREDFVRSTELFRRELLAHCYRMLGSVDEAEDLVQETYLRAWRSYAGFEGRSSVRVWLHRIATNACLTALEHRARRPLPSGLGAPSEDPHKLVPVGGPDITWLQPIPDALVTPASDDPAAVVAMRDSLRLALIASLQYPAAAAAASSATPTGRAGLVRRRSRRDARDHYSGGQEHTAACSRSAATCGSGRRHRTH
jgi:RNA polymerase sigma-70 factor (ECF subfamily)